MEFIGKLLKSIISSDWYILVAVVLTSFYLYKSVRLKNKINEQANHWEKERNLRISKGVYKETTISYTLFITFISLFPLFGMLGTVIALLNLDLSNIDNAKNNFFDALTSTTWGIIFSVIFKIINARIATEVENSIQKVSDIVARLEAMGVTLSTDKIEENTVKADENT